MSIIEETARVLQSTPIPVYYTGSLSHVHLSNLNGFFNNTSITL
jgi:hypothetical protein